MNPLTPHEPWMRKALDLAVRAFEEDEVPVGAVVVEGRVDFSGDEIVTGAAVAAPEPRVVGEGWNQREQLGDPTAHAEMIAITQAAESLGDWRLEGCTLYVTLEPCPMCAGAIVQARVPTVVYGAADAKAGACHSLYAITEDDRLNHRCTVLGGVMADDSAALLKEFFARKRALGKK
ncbi:MAG: nucleoside deaminase [Planctomycetota bacterium]